MHKLLIFAAMALATYFTRCTMIAVLGRNASSPPSHKTVSQRLLQRWLRHVPPAVLAALVVPAALAPHGRLELGLPACAVLAGAVVAWRTRSVLWTILGGMTAFWLLRLLGA
jgi:branched-subunit amino acid transport protein